MAISPENLPALALFSHIVQFGSLTGAADYLGMSRSSVSKQLSALEERLGIRLLQRSTRRLTLTEAGEQLLDDANRIAEALENVSALSEELQGQIRGHLKVSCSSGVGKLLLLPLLDSFNEQYPDVHIELLLEDRVIDLIKEKVDVSIRIGHIPDTSLVARKLGEMTWIICASPDYLRKHGTPLVPQDLLRHKCIFYSNNLTRSNNWQFIGPNGEESVTVDGPLSINDAGSLIQAAEAGMGVLCLDRNFLVGALNKGTVVPILQNYSMPTGYPIYALYPARKHLPSKTRVFVDFLFERFLR